MKVGDGGRRTAIKIGDGGRRTAMKIGDDGVGRRRWRTAMKIGDGDGDGGRRTAMKIGDDGVGRRRWRGTAMMAWDGDSDRRSRCWRFLFPISIRLDASLAVTSAKIQYLLINGYPTVVSELLLLAILLIQTVKKMNKLLPFSTLI
ncbi:hypothetical protein SO802_008699 [Lithocarpus litseifolius]|uniref:Uncharacterized protein n=1 Tax=Lithocarpus litseifolius TaxID=425828 RepID=A0AAW2D9Y7_9ROSI